jgi:hypothetical protein
MPTPREASQDISLLHIVATLPHSPGDAFQRQSRRRKLQVDYFHVIAKMFSGLRVDLHD